MKKIAYFLIFTLSLNAASTKDWPYLKRKVYIENEKQAPDINTYEWTRHIYKQCPDITLNHQIRNNIPFYKAIIKNSTEKANQKLKEYFKRWGAITIGLLGSCSGCFLIVYGFNDHVTCLNNNISYDDSVKKTKKSLGMIVIGCLLLRSFFISIKAYREYFKLKKTVKINKKMLASLQAAESTKI